MAYLDPYIESGEILSDRWIELPERLDIFVLAEIADDRCVRSEWLRQFQLVFNTWLRGTKLTKITLSNIQNNFSTINFPKDINSILDREITRGDIIFIFFACGDVNDGVIVTIFRNGAFIDYGISINDELCFVDNKLHELLIKLHGVASRGGIGSVIAAGREAEINETFCSMPEAVNRFFEMTSLSYLCCLAKDAPANLHAFAPIYAEDGRCVYARRELIDSISP